MTNRLKWKTTPRATKAWRKRQNRLHGGEDMKSAEPDVRTAGIKTGKGRIGAISVSFARRNPFKTLEERQMKVKLPGQRPINTTILYGEHEPLIKGTMQEVRSIRSGGKLSKGTSVEKVVTSAYDRQGRRVEAVVQDFLHFRGKVTPLRKARK